MPLYMDVHKKIEGLTAEAVVQAHQADLDLQDRHDVRYLRYWFSTDEGSVFCLVEAPSSDAAVSVHKEAHGLVPDEIIQVEEGT